jgi:CheY-like chemotaxis protein
LIKLLLADDSVTIQRVVELTFSGEDVQVTSVSDGEQAIARLPNERPDIVLADVGMPKRDGYEVAAYIKGHSDLAHIPVVLLAGAFEPVDEARAREVRCDGVLVKPFEPQQMIAKVRELVESAKPAANAASRSATASRPSPLHDARTSGPAAGPSPDRHAPSPRMGEGRLDEYFDRLDAAFASLGTSRAAAGRGPADDPFADKELPTVAGLVGDPTIRSQAGPVPEFGRVSAPPVEPPDVSPTLSAAPREHAPAAEPATPAGSNAIAEVFRALFAAEQGDRDALRRFQGAAQPMVTDELVNEITRRVLERLAPDTARHVVVDIVSGIAERLVREEIERIKKQKA